jgi:hypothetical protein
MLPSRLILTLRQPGRSSRAWTAEQPSEQTDILELVTTIHRINQPFRCAQRQSVSRERPTEVIGLVVTPLRDL